MNQIRFDKRSLNLSLMEDIINTIDQNGYLYEEIEDIIVRNGSNIKEVEEAIEILQTLEPIGVGARNLKECLLIQATFYHPNNDILGNLISHYLEQIALQNITFIMEETAYSLQEI